ncbi:MAG: GIY-YIG nuclease family protein [Flavobacteriaceae bacterium]|nr:GIY-YIG nuclease family protein [Flavobacteriaceae bacterium]
MSIKPNKLLPSQEAQMIKLWYVYIMSNRRNGVLYIGSTDNLGERVKEHKLKRFPNAFTARYNCDKLIYIEEYTNGVGASIREKRMKKWKREWKIKLINEINPSWMDISMNWKPDMTRFRTLQK